MAALLGWLLLLLLPLRFLPLLLLLLLPLRLLLLLPLRRAAAVRPCRCCADTVAGSASASATINS